MVLKNPNVNREERIRQLHDIKRRKDYFKSRKFTLSRRKYTAANGNEESPNNITTVQSSVNAAQGVMQTGGVIRTAVGGTRNKVGRIQTAVRTQSGAISELHAYRRWTRCGNPERRKWTGAMPRTGSLL